MKIRKLREARGNINYPDPTGDDFQDAMNKKRARKAARDDWDSYMQTTQKEQDLRDAKFLKTVYKECGVKLIAAQDKFEKFCDNNYDLIAQYFNNVDDTFMDNMLEILSKSFPKYHMTVDYSAGDFTAAIEIEEKDSGDKYDVSIWYSFSDVAMGIILDKEYTFSEDLQALLDITAEISDYKNTRACIRYICDNLDKSVDAIIALMKKNLMRMKLESVRYKKGSIRLTEDFNKFDNAYKDTLLKTSSDVISAYQDANKHLDEVKEFIYTDLSCPFFSSLVHSLAHSMPGRFDKFGDILHTINMRIPYPTTYQLDKELKNIDDCFDTIFESLDAIKKTLNKFIDATTKESHGMAVAAENLLNDIETEYPMLYRLEKKWEQSQNLVEFDKYVMQYVDHKDGLLENFRG